MRPTAMAKAIHAAQSGMPTTARNVFTVMSLGSRTGAGTARALTSSTDVEPSPKQPSPNAPKAKADCEGAAPVSLPPGLGVKSPGA